MKRQDLITALLKEGFSEKTLVKFSDKQIYNLSERILGEAITKQVKVYSMRNPKDAEEINTIVNDPKKVTDMSKQGHIQVTTEEKPSEVNEKDATPESRGKRKEMVKQGAYDGRFTTKVVKDKKKEENKYLSRDKKSFDLDEEKPSAGLSKEKKSEIVKKAKKGGDIGKKGKGFKKVEKAAKKAGAKDPKAVAAAAMWKNIKREDVEVKDWLKNLAESNFNGFTSKGEIMNLIQEKMNQHEVGPNVKKGHNGLPEFMTYDAITKSEVKESGTTTKPAPVKPTTKPGTKPKPSTPYQPGPGKNPKPKALKETKS